MSVLRTGLIGLGMMGRHHARVMRSIEGTELVAVADAMGDPHGVARDLPLYDSVQGLIDHGVDAVMCAVPTGLHEEVGMALAEQLLGELGDRIQRYTIVDLSGTLRERQHARLAASHPEQVRKVVWADNLPDDLQGVIVGNEVLDAMPVQLLHRVGGQWHERGVVLQPDAEAMRRCFASGA